MKVLSCCKRGAESQEKDCKTQRINGDHKSNVRQISILKHNHPIVCVLRFYELNIRNCHREGVKTKLWINPLKTMLSSKKMTAKQQPHIINIGIAQLPIA